ncbi:SDR family NAD(P)-dependent oxidoreductase [Dactylosporangium sp. CA-233914]|uniref:SDR family NAD(P)-dependent oxidoreductase n=1 Tax=Dactylosporangium sp. CA-233914 TaxID=3239934 RepID=UPI003D8D9D07
MTEFTGQVALVTGSTRGIGAAIARRFAAEGAAVVVHGRDQQAAAEVQQQITADGGRAVTVLADLTEFTQVEAMRSAIEDALGPVDILVANAGGNPVPPGPIEEMTEQGWRAAIDANLTATFLTVKAFLPGMKQRRRGVVLTLSSAASRRPTAFSPAGYPAAKAGIEVLTRQVALQAGPFGIRAACIAPETILTERNRGQIPEHVQQQLIQAHPIQRLGTPEDVADAAVFLASRHSAWITGVTLDVAGGSVLA